MDSIQNDVLLEWFKLSQFPNSTRWTRWMGGLFQQYLWKPNEFATPLRQQFLLPIVSGYPGRLLCACIHHVLNIEVDLMKTPCTVPLLGLYTLQRAVQPASSRPHSRLSDRLPATLHRRSRHRDEGTRPSSSQWSSEGGYPVLQGWAEPVYRRGSVQSVRAHLPRGPPARGGESSYGYAQTGQGERLRRTATGGPVRSIHPQRYWQHARIS
jgi:hypothetical protein